MDYRDPGKQESCSGLPPLPRVLDPHVPLRYQWLQRFIYYAKI